MRHSWVAKFGVLCLNQLVQSATKGVRLVCFVFSFGHGGATDHTGHADFVKVPTEKLQPERINSLAFNERASTIILVRSKLGVMPQGAQGALNAAE